MPKRSRGTSPTSTPQVDDPRIESDFAEAEAATAAFRDRTYGKVATLSAAELADAIDEYERIEAIATRALYYAHMTLLHQHGRPRPRRARREARREGRRASRRSSSSSSSSGPRSTTRQPRRCSRTRRSTTGATGSRRSACSGRTCSPSRRRRSSPRRPSPGVSAWSRLYEEVLGGSASALDGEEAPVALESAIAHLYSADRDVRRAAAEGVTEALSPGSGPARRLQHDPRRQVDRRPAARLPDLDHVAQPRQRDHQTRPSTRSSSATTSRYDVPQRSTASRRGCSGLDRLEHYDRSAPVSTDTRKSTEARRIVVDAYSQFSDEAGGIGALLRRQLDRCLFGRTRETRGVLRHEPVPGVHPYVLMKLPATADRS